MHIGIAGNIGCGKTTLTRMLAEHYGWTPKFEAVTYNPYLEDYYHDIERWSYNLETYFLAQRFQDLVEISKSKDVIIPVRKVSHCLVVGHEYVYAFQDGSILDDDVLGFGNLYKVLESLCKEVCLEIV